jgi:hypothetical protein
MRKTVYIQEETFNKLRFLAANAEVKTFIHQVAERLITENLDTEVAKLEKLLAKHDDNEMKKAAKK